MVTEKKPILENAIEYIWVNNAQLDLVTSILFTSGLNHLQLNHLQNLNN